MSEKRDQTDDSVVNAMDSTALNERLARVSDENGVSKQELVDEMLSSYWILNELTGLIDEGSSNQSAVNVAHSPTEQEATQDSADSPEESNKDHSNKETSEQSSNPVSPEQLKQLEGNIESLQAVIEQLAMAQVGNQVSPERESVSRGADSLSSESLEMNASYVLDELKRIESELEKLDRIDKLEAELSKLDRTENVKLDQINEIEAQLSDLEKKQTSDIERLSDELQLLLNRVNELERKDFVSSKEFETFSEEIETSIDTIAEDQKTLKKDVENEFDNIEKLFKDLIKRINDIDEEVEGVSESYEENISRINESEKEQRQLENLKSKAMLKETRKGTCSNCNQAVDIGLLESPYCPKCDGKFTDITDSGWNPFKPPILEANPP